MLLRTENQPEAFKGGSETYIETTHPFLVMREERAGLEISDGKYRMHAVLERDRFIAEMADLNG